MSGESESEGTGVLTFFLIVTQRCGYSREIREIMRDGGLGGGGLWG